MSRSTSSSKEPPPEPYKTWQEALAEEYRKRNMHPPVYNIISDRRGGRTAWSSTVTVAEEKGGEKTINARYWYDGQFVNNAKEDAATVAYKQLTSRSNTEGASESNAEET